MKNAIVLRPVPYEAISTPVLHRELRTLALAAHYLRKECEAAAKRDDIEYYADALIEYLHASQDFCVVECILQERHRSGYPQ